MAEWQPIETAPKDGTVIGGWSAAAPGVVRLVHWGHHLSNPRYAAGWVTSTKSLAVSNVPTHWIPAPQQQPGAPGVAPCGEGRKP